MASTFRKRPRSPLAEPWGRMGVLNQISPFSARGHFENLNKPCSRYEPLWAQKRRAWDDPRSALTYLAFYREIVDFSQSSIRKVRTLSDSALRFRRTTAALVRFRGSSFSAPCATEAKGSGFGSSDTFGQTDCVIVKVGQTSCVNQTTYTELTTRDPLGSTGDSKDVSSL